MTEKEDKCLSSCTWRKNPFFKFNPGYLIFDPNNLADWGHYKTKWWEGATLYSKANTFPQLYDVPSVPTDLTCLTDCFEKVKSDTPLKKEIQKYCSANGLDRQIPTHVKEAKAYVDSKYANKTIPA